MTNYTHAPSVTNSSAFQACLRSSSSICGNSTTTAAAVRDRGHRVVSIWGCNMSSVFLMNGNEDNHTTYIDHQHWIYLYQSFQVTITDHINLPLPAVSGCPCKLRTSNFYQLGYPYKPHKFTFTVLVILPLQTT